ncbi:MAG TPA: hypothetical protein VES42_28330, partial [Pilimelia sp.]|nr:hypothetical protein [Pilimelia sp.]
TVPPAQPARTTATTAASQATPPTAAASPTVREAVAELSQVIDEGLAVGDIRRDAGLDLQQMLNQLRVAVGRGPVDVQGRVLNLREKVAARADEGAITSSYEGRLHAALDVLALARMS